jgi:hypothetical protein
MQVKRGFMCPSCNGVVRDIDIKNGIHNINDFRSRQRFKHSKIEGKRDSGLREIHFIPGERNGQIKLNSFKGVIRDVKRASWEREIDFMIAFIVVIFLIIVTAESESIGEVFKDMHAGAAFGTENFGFFLDTEGFTRNELSFAGRIFTAELLFSGKRIFTEFPCIRFT